MSKTINQLLIYYIPLGIDVITYGITLLFFIQVIKSNFV